MLKEANVTVRVSDMPRAVAFYRDVLGLAVVRDFGEHWQEVEGPGLRIGLHPGGKRPLVPHGRHLQIGLRVDDLDAIVARLEARGVKFERVADRGSRIANFEDPDGNPLYFIELKWG
jgi:catechol 2,3-dioxygenase-like lactoylglutathione lyase family enzyme